jgi:hypothetical protein
LDLLIINLHSLFKIVFFINTMSLSLSPVSYLSEPSYVRRSVAKSKLQFLDYAFLMTILVVICGGCLFMMDLASAHSTGRESAILSFVSGLSQSVPALLGEVSTYFTLFLSSILTSAILVAFVCGLRALDQKVTSTPSSSFLTVRAAQEASVNQYKAALRGRESRLFLLSPVFQ